MPLTAKYLNFAKGLSYSELERVSKSHIPKFSIITVSLVSFVILVSFNRYESRDPIKKLPVIILDRYFRRYSKN